MEYRESQCVWWWCIEVCPGVDITCTRLIVHTVTLFYQIDVCRERAGSTALSQNVIVTIKGSFCSILLEVSPLCIRQASAWTIPLYDGLRSNRLHVTKTIILKGQCLYWGVGLLNELPQSWIDRLAEIKGFVVGNTLKIKIYWQKVGGNAQVGRFSSLSNVIEFRRGRKNEKQIVWFIETIYIAVKTTWYNNTYVCDYIQRSVC